MKSVLTFDVHDYAPEQNKIFLNGKNVTNIYPYSRVDKTTLTKNYNNNLRLVRNGLNYPTYNHRIRVKLHGITNDFVKSFGGGFNNWIDAYNLIKKQKKWFADGCTSSFEFYF